MEFAQEAFIFQLRSMIEQLKPIESQVKETDKEIQRIMNNVDSVILTIPGIGPIGGATILGEIGHIHKSKKLVAYAGIDASVTQSGQYEANHNVMSTRGSPYLQKALFSAALIASQCDPVFSAFYQEKFLKENIS